MYVGRQRHGFPHFSSTKDYGIRTPLMANGVNIQGTSCLTLSLPSSKLVRSPNLLKEKCIEEAMITGSIIILSAHLESTAVGRSVNRPTVDCRSRLSVDCQPTVGFRVLVHMIREHEVELRRMSA